MAYSELIKNFERTRSYMREFYVYGFKSRTEYDRKSARSYDDERRRIESWLDGCMGFNRTPDGKNVFISIDSRERRQNPLFSAWKAKSFTDGDITLHFIIFEILSDPEIKLTVKEIIDKADGILKSFSEPKTFDESTVRKKLEEYVKEGLIRKEKDGKTIRYFRAGDFTLNCPEAVSFFSETAPCGVIGSFLLDRGENTAAPFSYKHHYITQTMDSEVLCALFEAMHGKRFVTVSTVNRRGETVTEKAVGLRIYISVQSGRQYLMAHFEKYKRIQSVRIDRIVSVKAEEPCERFDELREKLETMSGHIWGVSTKDCEHTEHVEFTVTYEDGEEYIPQRLEREKRCGTVEHIDSHTSRFSADLFDSKEIVPWMRSFICRIASFSFSNEEVQRGFQCDIDEMCRMYGIEGGGAE